MSKKSRHPLTYEERCQIYALLKSGYSKRKIGQLLDRSHSTIIRETLRNKGFRGYCLSQADEKLNIDVLKQEAKENDTKINQTERHDA